MFPFEADHQVQNLSRLKRVPAIDEVQFQIFVLVCLSVDIFFSNFEYDNVCLSEKTPVLISV